MPPLAPYRFSIRTIPQGGSLYSVVWSWQVDPAETIAWSDLRPSTSHAVTPFWTDSTLPMTAGHYAHPLGGGIGPYKIGARMKSAVDNTYSTEILHDLLDATDNSGPLVDPTGVTGAPGNASATISWNAVAGATGYKVWNGDGGIDGGSQALKGVTSGTSLLITGLSNGFEYPFFVTAFNDDYHETWASEVVRVTPVDGTPLPHIASVSNGDGASALTMSTTPGAGFARYDIYLDGVLYATTTNPASFTVAGLTNGVTYDCYVTEVYTPLSYNGPSNTVTLSPRADEEPPVDPGGEGGAAPTDRFDVEVRFFDRATGLRKPFNPDDMTNGLTWDFSESGGCHTARVPLAKAFDALDWSVEGGDSGEIWVLGETTPRWRGTVVQPEATLDLEEARTLLLNGRLEDMNHVDVRGVFVRSGGMDVSVIAAEIFKDYCRQRGRTFLADIREIGVKLERVEIDTSAREALDHLQGQAQGGVVWGWEIDPASGEDRFYFRRRVETVGHQFFVGDRVRVLHEPFEFQNVKNAAWVRGGPAKYPNMLAHIADNTGFERPALAGESVGNLLEDPGFENRSGWTLSGGASYKAGGLSEGPAYAGDDMVELDAVGEKLSQTENAVSGVVAGDDFAFQVQARREVGANAAEAILRLKWLNAVGSVLQTDTAPVKPAAALWDEFAGTSRCPENATGYIFEVECLTTSGSTGLVIDGCALFNKSRAQQEGWETKPHGGARVEAIDWTYTADRYEGRHCVFLQVAASDADNEDVHLRPLNEAMFPVRPNQTLLLTARIKSPPGVSANGKFFLEIETFKSDGSRAGDRVRETVAAGAGWADWTLLSATKTAPPDAVQAIIRFNFRGNGAYLIDAVCVADEAGGSEYRRGLDFERYVTAEEVCTPGSDAYASFATYGRRVQPQLADREIVAWDADAQAKIKAWFERHAVPASRPRVELLHEPARRISPGDATQVRVSGLARHLKDSWPARAAYTWASASLSVGIELDRERPTWAKLLKNRGQLSAGGGGASSAPPKAGGLAQGGVALSALVPSPAGTYGSPTAFPVVTLDDYGRVTVAAEQTIAASGLTTRWVPLSNGDPADPLLIFDALGQVIVVEEAL